MRIPSNHCPRTLGRYTQAFTDRFQSTLAQRPSTLNLEAVADLANMPELATEDANAQP